MKNVHRQIALAGGIELEICLADQLKKEMIKVRQVPIRDYDAGFKLVDDEPALVSFLAGKPKDWSLTLAPESYELILEKGREVNRIGFFPYCQRRTEREQTRTLQMLQNVPPQALEMIVNLGKKSISPNLPPGWQPPQG